MKHLIRLIVVGLLASAAWFMTAAPASAEPYRSPADCNASTMAYDTNDWAFFAGHLIRVRAGQCGNGNKIKYAQNPIVSFPSRGPQGATEDITLTAAPRIVRIDSVTNGAVRVVWQFSVAQKVFKLPFANNFDITFSTWPIQNQLCSAGGNCDGAEQAYLSTSGRR